MRLLRFWPHDCGPVAWLWSTLLLSQPHGEVNEYQPSSGPDGSSFSSSAPPLPPSAPRPQMLAPGAFVIWRGSHCLFLAGFALPVFQPHNNCTDPRTFSCTVIPIPTCCPNNWNEHLKPGGASHASVPPCGALRTHSLRIPVVYAPFRRRKHPARPARTVRRATMLLRIACGQFQ